MKVLIFTQHYWPEQFLINELSAALAERGNKLTIATGKPNYPKGKFYEGYGFWGPAKQDLGNGVVIYRCPIIPRKSGRAHNLVMNYLSFIFWGLFWFPVALAFKKVDVIFVFGTSPILQAIPAIFLKFVKRVPLVLWVQDLWPESLSATGFVRSQFALKMVGVVVNWIYRKSDLILGQSEAFVCEIKKRVSDSTKVKFFPNFFSEVESENASDVSLPPKLGALLDEKFCVTFAGNMGQAQALPTVINAARQIQDLENVRIVLVGSGSFEAEARQLVTSLGLKNVYFAGRFPQDHMAPIFSKSKALLVSLGKEPILGQTIPSKVQAYLAAGRPIVGSLDGEGARVIHQAEAGLVSGAEDADALAANIRKLSFYSDQTLDNLGRNGRVFFEKYFRLSEKAQELEKMLECISREK